MCLPTQLSSCLLILIIFPALITSAGKWRGHWSWATAEESTRDIFNTSQFINPLSPTPFLPKIPKIVASTSIVDMGIMDTDSRHHNSRHHHHHHHHGHRNSVRGGDNWSGGGANGAGGGKRDSSLENVVQGLSRELEQLRQSMDSVNHKMQEMESEHQQQNRLRPSSSAPSFSSSSDPMILDPEETKTRKLVNRLYFSNTCGGLVELHQVSELSYVRPSSLDDLNDGPETCVWVLVTSNYNQIGLTLRGLELPPTASSGSDSRHDKSRMGLSAQILDHFPQSHLKHLGSRDLNREYIAPASEVVLIFSTSNSTRDTQQGFRLNLRGVERQKTASFKTVTVHSEWNLLGDKTGSRRSLRYPFGGGNYGNQTSVYFLFHPGQGRKAWATVNFQSVRSVHSALAVYKYSGEYQEFGRIAKLVHFSVSDVPDDDHVGAEDRQYTGNYNQPLLLQLNSAFAGWGEGFTISFGYQPA